MPPDDGIRLDEDQGPAPVAPRVGKDHPEESIGRANVRPVDSAPQRHQLLTKRQVLKSDSVLSTAHQSDRSKNQDKRGKHAGSCREFGHRINGLAPRVDFGEPQPYFT